MSRQPLSQVILNSSYIVNGQVLPKPFISVTSFNTGTRMTLSLTGPDKQILKAAIGHLKANLNGLLYPLSLQDSVVQWDSDIPDDRGNTESVEVFKRKWVPGRETLNPAKDMQLIHMGFNNASSNER